MPTQVCPACGADIDVSAMFPGASVQCRCGTMTTVAASRPLSPYRSADRPPLSSSEPRPELRDSTTTDHSPRCPVCESVLETQTFGQHNVDACPSGHGLFVDPVVLDRILTVASVSRDAQAPSGNTLATPVRYRDCPVCRQTMTRKVFEQRSGIVIDVCPKHGTWFDTHELELAIAFARAHGFTPSQRQAKQHNHQAAIESALRLEFQREDQEVQQKFDVLRAFAEAVRWVVG